jgi:hypothetical protein
MFRRGLALLNFPLLLNYPKLAFFIIDVKTSSFGGGYVFSIVPISGNIESISRQS